MIKYRLEFPPDFGEHAYEWNAKGCFGGARLWCEGREYALNFYTPAVLAREVERELARGILFFEPNLVVVRETTRATMESAVARIVESGTVDSLTPDQVG